MAIDMNAIEKNVREILIALGENPDREGLKETPKRVAKMCGEILNGMNYTNEEIADMCNKTFSDDLDIGEKCGDMVIIKDIDIFSLCEHHLALMYNMKVCVSYIPKDKVIGLSKVARIAELVSHRLQLQERIGKEIADIVKKILDTENVAVIIEGEHGCMTARGIKKTGTKTITTNFNGLYKDDIGVRNQFLMLYR